MFEPDVERNGMPFDYAEELLSNPDNIELKIEGRQSTESAIGKKHPNTSSELPSGNSIRNSDGVVNTKSSLSANGQVEDLGPVAWQVKGEDVALEDGAKNGEIATSPAAPRNDSSIGDGVALGDIGTVVGNTGGTDARSVQEEGPMRAPVSEDSAAYTQIHPDVAMVSRR